VSTAAAERLDAEFFARSVHTVARDLIGCRLYYAGCGGTIVETESYERDDPACHAYVGLTKRTEVLFGPPGRAYVYLSYGIHSLLNFVAEPAGEAAAVLIRALEPSTGLEAMRARRGDRAAQMAPISPPSRSSCCRRSRGGTGRWSPDPGWGSPKQSIGPGASASRTAVTSRRRGRSSRANPR
jgi:3-methyladenine DNA glycosylase Mpg